MIRNSLSTRNKLDTYVSFRIIDITLVNSEGFECGLVSYVRLGYNKDVLDTIIYESIRQNYRLSKMGIKNYVTSTPSESFKTYDMSTRMYISVKNSIRKDYGYEDDTLDSMLAIFLDVYNPTDAFVYNEIQMYSRISSENISRAANEIEHNFETYNGFVR